MVEYLAEYLAQYLVQGPGSSELAASLGPLLPDRRRGRFS
jgi:hypothetical protein